MSEFLLAYWAGCIVEGSMRTMPPFLPHLSDHPAIEHLSDLFSQDTYLLRANFYRSSKSEFFESTFNLMRNKSRTHFAPYALSLRFSRLVEEVPARFLGGVPSLGEAFYPSQDFSKHL